MQLIWQNQKLHFMASCNMFIFGQMGMYWDQIEKGTNEAIEDFTEFGRMVHDAITPTPVTTGETYTAPTNPSDNTRVPTPLITPLKEEGIPNITLPNQVSNDSQPQMSAAPPKRL